MSRRRKVIALAVLFAGIVWLGFVRVAEAQDLPANCGPRAAVIATLAERYGEGVALRGLTVDGKLMEVWLAEGGTWTILVSTAQGTSCLAASGTHGETPPVPAGTLH